MLDIILGIIIAAIVISLLIILVIAAVKCLPKQEQPGISISVEDYAIYLENPRGTIGVDVNRKLKIIADKKETERQLHILVDDAKRIYDSGEYLVPASRGR